MTPRNVVPINLNLPMKTLYSIPDEDLNESVPDKSVLTQELYDCIINVIRARLSIANDLLLICFQVMGITGDDAQQNFDEF